MKELFYTARSGNNIAKNVLFGLLGTAAIFVVAAYVSPILTGIIWMVALGFITAAIYVYNRYVAAEYCYGITNDGGIPSFTVSMKVGKTSRVMARIDLSSITEVKKMSREEYRAYKPEKGIIRFPYFPTMFAETVYVVASRSEHESADIVVECDESFATALENFGVNE